MDYLADLFSNRFVVAIGVGVSALALGFHIGIEWKSRHLKNRTPPSGGREILLGKSYYEERPDKGEKTLLGYVMEHTNEHPILSELRQVRV